MMFVLSFSDRAKEQLRDLKASPDLKKRFKAVSKSLNYPQTNPRHSSLNTHPFHSNHGPCGEKLFEAYAENNTPGAYRIFFYYGPGDKEVTIFSIIPHP